jgi:uncharacterized protein (TIGR03545 family)
MFRRKGLLIPIAMAGVAALYLHFFADLQLRSMLENYASVVNGAQVNIGELRTHWLRGQIDLGKIQIAHHTQPSRNLFELEKASVRFLWLPLLAGKFVSPEIRISGVKLFTPRETFGAITVTSDASPLPPALLDRVATGAYEPLRRSLSDTPLRKLGLLSAGLSTQSRIDQMRGGLTSLSAIAEITKEVETKARTWEKAAAVFQPPSWVESAKLFLAETGRSKSRNLASSDLSIPSIVQRLKDERESAKQAYQGIQAEAASFRKQMQNVDEYLSQDVAVIRDSFGLPRLDGGDFTHALLGPKFLNFLERASYWVDVSRRRMPTTGHDFGGIIVMELNADSGRNILFGKKSTYPLVLLQRVVFDSKLNPQETNQGQVTGELKNFTTDPPIWRQPTEFTLKADFPAMGVRNLNVDIQVLHTQSPPSEIFKLSVDSFPLRDWLLENTPDLRLAVKRADAKIQFEGKFEAEALLTQWSVVAAQAEYSIDTRFRLMQETMREAFVPFSSLNVSGTVRGTAQDLTLQLESNVGKRLGIVLKDKFKHSLAAVDDTLRQSLLDRIEYPRRRLREQLMEVLNGISEQYEHHSTELDALERALQQLVPKPRQRMSRS